MLDKNSYILVYDSGNGGKFVLSKLKKRLPFEKFILFRDIYFCPYGDKTKSNLKKNTTKILDYLTKMYKIKMIIIACNTISSLFKSYILKRYSNYIILFVNPYLNEKILLKKTLVIATKNTIKYNSLLKKFSNNKNLFLVGFNDLAKKIDDNINNLGTLLPQIYTKIEPYVKLDIQNVVVGCTHYNYIIFLLKQIFPKAKFFESSSNVALLAKKLLAMYELENEENIKSKTLNLYKID